LALLIVLVLTRMQSFAEAGKSDLGQDASISAKVPKGSESTVAAGDVAAGVTSC
jgi:hypothetical protein